MLIPILTVAVRLVGGVIVLTGLIKTLSPYGFRSHLYDLDILPTDALVTVAVASAAGLEIAWGLALLLNVAPNVLLPFSVVALIVLTAVSVSGVRRGKTEDCGCYGGYLQLSIAQSAALNALFLAILAAAWFAGVGGRVNVGGAGAALAAGILAGALAFAGDKYERETGKALIELSPLKPGKRWNDAWVAGATTGLDGEFYVSFLSASCPCCKMWIKVANAMTQSPELPKVVGVASSSPEAIQELVADYRITFPVSRIPSSLMGRMTRKVPTIVLVRDRVIDSVFTGLLPVEHTPRFLKAFFPSTSPDPIRTPELATISRIR